MESTRRNFLGTVGAGALTVAAVNAAETGSARSGNPKLYVAVVTPVDSKNRFDDGLFRDLMPYFKERNVDGALVLGTTGEFPSFSVAERKKVAETALKHRAGLRMIVQVGTPNLPETLELLNHAGANGADGALCIPPFYFKNPPVEGLYKYYSQVLEATKLPVYLYHYPGDERGAHYARVAAQAGTLSESGGHQGFHRQRRKPTPRSARSFPSSI